MGIPKFYKWIRDNYQTVLNVELPKYIRSLWVDLNSMIHKAAQLTYGYDDPTNIVKKGKYEKQLKEELAEINRKIREKVNSRTEDENFSHFLSIFFTLLIDAINAINPQDLLVLAVDGVAPLAKITQQRKRRFKASKSRHDEKIFDSNNITPGTTFMINLDKHIRKWIANNNKQLPQKVIYSSHLVPGEGEHKIIDMIRDGKIKDMDVGGHVLYGMDADLILLGLVAPTNNIYLLEKI